MITLAGLVLAVTFTACVAAVLMLMAEIARPTPQGGSTAVPVRYAAERPVRVRMPPGARHRGRGRHRRG